MTEPAMFLAKVARRRRVRRAKLGAAAAIVLAALGGVYALISPRPSASEPGLVKSDPRAHPTADQPLGSAIARRTGTLGSGLRATLVPRAGSRPGSAAWTELLEGVLTTSKPDPTAAEHPTPPGP